MSGVDRPDEELDPALEELLEQGRAAFARGEFRKARKHFSQVVLRVPSDARAQYWFGVAQYHMGHVGDALEHPQRAAAAARPPLPPRPAAVYEYLSRCHLLGLWAGCMKLGAGVELAAIDELFPERAWKREVKRIGFQAETDRSSRRSA